MPASTSGPGEICPSNETPDSGSITSTGVQNSTGNLGWSTGFCGNTDPIECNAYSGEDVWGCSDLTTGDSWVSPYYSFRCEVEVLNRLLIAGTDLPWCVWNCFSTVRSSKCGHWIWWIHRTVHLHYISRQLLRVAMILSCSKRIQNSMQTPGSLEDEGYLLGLGLIALTVLRFCTLNEWPDSTNEETTPTMKFDYSETYDSIWKLKQFAVITTLLTWIRTKVLLKLEKRIWKLFNQKIKNEGPRRRFWELKSFLGIII